jgi:Ig-like domain from next to BRCA1 gene/Glycosyl transferase family 2
MVYDRNQKMRRKMDSLSVVIPAYNEEATVKGALREVSLVAPQLGIQYEIILVNDGSKDRTGEIGHQMAGEIPKLHVVEHRPNRGYGGALRAGFAAATKDLIALYPADRQFRFDEIRLLLEHADVTIPDGTELYPSQTFTKTWLLKNTGICTWSTSYELTFTSGSEMSGSATAIEESVEPGSEVEVLVSLTALSTAGIYTGYWRLANESGSAFGTSIYVEIIVSTDADTLTPTTTSTLTATSTAASSTNTPTSTPAATSTPTTIPTSTAIKRATSTLTAIPTNTSASTSTSIPTSTPAPTGTSAFTNTLYPTNTPSSE